MQVFRLEGSSMLPIFKPGEISLVLPGGLAPGDCAVYLYRGRALLHRVVRVSAAGAWLADDAGRLEPHFVPLEDIKGKALGGFLAGGLPGRLYSALRRRIFALLRREVSAETSPSQSSVARGAAYTLSGLSRIALGPRPAGAGNPAGQDLG